MEGVKLCMRLRSTYTYRPVLAVCACNVPTLYGVARGVATGGYMGIYTPKVSPSQLFMGVKMTSLTAIEHDY